jgi:4-hydroxybenzoyl-CoA thioesterase
MAYTSIQKIRFDDVDGAGIVYYPRFLHLCHAAFEDFFDDVAPFGYPQLIRDRRLGFPTVHIDADFKAPLSYGDIAVVTLSVVRVGTSSMTMAYEVRRKRDSTLCFVAQITSVLIDLDTQRSQPITAEIRGVLERYLVGRAPESVAAPSSSRDRAG